MTAEPSTPPLEPLLAMVRRIERARIVCALGGSGLLVALGLAETARDWDLTADAPLEAVIPLAEGYAFETSGPGGVHADSKLVLPELGIEVIARFAFHGPAGVIRMPTVVTRRWHGVPLGSPEAWAVAYHLLGRPEKRDLLLGHLRAKGHDAHTVARLLAQPLPGDVADILLGL